MVADAPISVVIPAWNEERRIGSTLGRLLVEAPALGISEVIVVSDGSTDRTADIVRSHRAAGAYRSA